MIDPNYLATGAVSIIVALVTAYGTVWSKKTPESESPEKIASQQIDMLMKRVEYLDKKTVEDEARYEARYEATEQKIKELQKRVDELSNMVVHARRHIVRLEEQLIDLDVDPIPRPLEVESLFR